MTEDRTPTPARLLEDHFGGSRALTAESIPAVVEMASQRGILDVTLDYIRYRRPELSDTIDQVLRQR
jgi:hypothetical protein